MEGKAIEKKYRKLDDIEHVLLRPGMYVGSTKPKEEEIFLPSGDATRVLLRKVTYNPAFLKLFDEILSNSGDEHRRNPKLNSIRVEVDRAESRITVWDNGGIPVVKHPAHDEWVPEMIFSNLKAGSNFNDEEDRLVAGTNGVGSTLTNIFSKEFRVRTCDRKSEFDQVFRNNMRDRAPAKVAPSKSKGYTEISFCPDLGRFGLEGIDEDHLDMLRKRCYETVACNPNLKISFSHVSSKGKTEETISFRNFREYCDLYARREEGEPALPLLYVESPRWRVGVLPSEGSFTQVSYVNSVETKDGGTHVDLVANQIVNALRERIKKKHKLDLKPQEIKNHLFVLVQADVVNPAFSSQTKEKLITEPRDFGSKWTLPESLLRDIFGSEILQRILDWAAQKAKAEESKKLREINKLIGKEKILKLIDAKASVGRERCSLALFEGDSAISAFRKYRDPAFQGAFPLRGKVLNVTGLSPADAARNNEIKSLLIAIGLKMGERAVGLRYGKILIYADADPDGDSIAGLLINFFGRYWPELFEQERVLRVMTPLVVAKRGSTSHSFYTAEEFEAWQREQGDKELKRWDIAYKKGLAALEDEQYLEIIKNPRMFAIRPGDNFTEVLDTWFSNDPKLRKNKILVEETPND